MMIFGGGQEGQMAGEGGDGRGQEGQRVIARVVGAGGWWGQEGGGGRRVVEQESQMVGVVGQEGLGGSQMGQMQWGKEGQMAWG